MCNHFCVFHYAQPDSNPLFTLTLPAQQAAVDRIFGAFNTHTPGCAVGVARHGTVAYKVGYGMADLERNVPISAETVFESGSVAKQFTAAALLLLARQGKISRDDPMRKYLPELPDYGAPLTVRHVISHVSGLRTIDSGHRHRQTARIDADIPECLLDAGRR